VNSGGTGHSVFCPFPKAKFWSWANMVALMKPRMTSPSAGGACARIEATQKTAHAARTVIRTHRFIGVSFLPKTYADREGA
jgi:hypothetical protein